MWIIKLGGACYTAIDFLYDMVGWVGAREAAGG